MTMKNVLSFAAFGVIIVFAIGYLGSFGLRVRPPAGTHLSMAVPDTNDLNVGANVLLRGVSIGKVTGIKAGTEDATVDFYVDAAYDIPVDSDVRIENLSALGETYIGLSPRTNDGPMLKDGQRIATESITLPPSISQLATSVVRVLNQLDPEQLKRILGEADAALPDPVAVEPNLSRASMLLNSTAKGMHGRGQEVLGNFQTLLQNAGWVGPALADVQHPLRGLGEGLRDSYNMLARAAIWDNPETIKQTGYLLDRIQHFLDDRGSDIKVLSEALQPKVEGISGALMNFDSAQILTNMLAAYPEDGAITLHVAIPEG
ncbi:MCE family protein [Mycolicibacterium peregrinum]|uniref:MlaD family protein n=1 Tax=Mycolicibacterium TaxID=1866885 RepID=UPI0006D833F5|nr:MULTISPECIES: MlaD family protein [Mycolicibacterium]MCV7205074.1 MCE family protein [Mycolicibacterium peregrinum]ODR24880.1 mammalian cell entry protein [Mycolicibacterium porcinum]ORW53941.1 mammalian cell entry protein [Mycolicibacterium peregrinum]